MQIDNIHTEQLFDKAYGDRSPEFYSDLLAEIISLGRPGRILDCGAGLGLFAELGHMWGLDITGIEGSPYAVNQAKSRVNHLNMIVHDLGEPFPFANGVFCNIVLNQVVEHISQARLDNVLKESLRILVEGGCIFIYSPSRKNIKEKSQLTHINMMSPSELKQCLEGHGFKIVSCPNYGFWFKPDAGPLARKISHRLLKILPHDWLSATANAIAIKG